MAVTVVNGTDSIDTWRQKTNTISTTLGDPSALTTTANDVVAGINELDNEQGTLSSLSTTAKGNLVAAVNEMKTELDNATGGAAIPRPALIAMA
jgi:hypothetical protein|tara:strand:+ start:1462 stop:1743 length:282 start_codon:yes stop_codon:yes gene_type:complete